MGLMELNLVLPFHMVGVCRSCMASTYCKTSHSKSFSMRRTHTLFASVCHTMSLCGQTLRFFFVVFFVLLLVCLVSVSRARYKCFANQVYVVSRKHVCGRDVRRQFALLPARMLLKTVS